MKKYLVLLLIASLAVFTACSSSNDEEKVNEFEVLVDYLENGDPDYEGWVNTLNGWINTAHTGDSTYTFSEYFIIDLRAESAFNTKHLPGAVNVTLDNMFNEIDEKNTSNKPILVTCYSGQTASFAHMLLRLKGYEAYTHGFGMSAHHPSLDVWTSKCSNQFADKANWVKEAAPELPSFSYPTLNTGQKTAEAILDARIDAAIQAWKDGLLVSSTTVVNDPGAYNIACYWSATDYDHYGCIDGAYQVTPKTLKKSDYLSVFDPAGNNIFYCWTGQTAAASIAYLTVLGYDVKSIAYASNNMIYDELTSHKWSKPWGTGE